MTWQLKLIAIIVSLAAAVALFFYVKSLRSDVETLTIKNLNLQLENEKLVNAVEKIQADHNTQLANIKSLEKNRQAAQQTVEPFLIRLDEITLQESTNGAPNDLIGNLNGLNTELNRMLEDSTR